VTECTRKPCVACDVANQAENQITALRKHLAAALHERAALKATVDRVQQEIALLREHTRSPETDPVRREGLIQFLNLFQALLDGGEG
jgi:hypothetical protein